MTVKKTVSLPTKLARAAEAVARAEGKSFSTVVQEALRIFLAERRHAELCDLQSYWGLQARERGIGSEGDLDRYLAE